MSISINNSRRGSASTRLRRGGFVALISMIILGFVLLLAVLTLGNRSIGGRFILLDLERKEMSDELASACVQVAIIALVNDPAYVLPGAPAPYPVPVGDSECEIVSIEHAGGLSTIRAHAEVSGATTNIEAVWDSTVEQVDSWQEKQAFL